LKDTYNPYLVLQGPEICQDDNITTYSTAQQLFEQVRPAASRV